MLGHPAFVPRHRRGDAECEALLAEQSIATVAGAEAPDLTRLREVHDVFFLVRRPRDIRLTRLQRHADRVHARDDALEILVDQLEHLFADARHDAHVHDHVGRVGELHADLRHRRTDGAHAERQHIHRAALHAAGEKSLERLPHLERIHPIVGRTGGLFGQRTYISAILLARDVARIGTRQITARPFFFVKFGKRAAGDQLGAQRIVFFLRTVAPVNAGRLGQCGKFRDPTDDFLMFHIVGHVQCGYASQHGLIHFSLQTIKKSCRHMPLLSSGGGMHALVGRPASHALFSVLVAVLPAAPGSDSQS